LNSKVVIEAKNPNRNWVREAVPHPPRGAKNQRKKEKSLVISTNAESNSMQTKSLNRQVTWDLCGQLMLKKLPAFLCTVPNEKTS
jgi:hypothetical protein